MSDNNEIITFGCRLNSYESQIIKDNLKEANLDNIAVFNTCAVTNEAIRQGKQAIRKYIREHPDKKIIVTGCAAQINPDEYASIKGVDKVLGNQEKLEKKHFTDLTPKTEKILVNDIMSVKETATHLIKEFDGKARCFVQIQNGCNHRCTFCQIPYGRGNSRSVPVGVIVEQIRQLVENGYKEIVLTGVDISDYGLDLPGAPSLGQMIRRLLNSIPELPRLRLSSIDVAEINEDLLELIYNEKRFMPYLHISLQAGDDLILKRMKRRHNRKQVIDFCDNVRKYRPEVGFGADIIAGFPTETNEHFLNTLNLIKEAKIVYPHIFPYSQLQGTPAARMPQVDVAVRKERAKILRQEGERQYLEFLSENIGKYTNILVEQNNIARCENFAKVKLDESWNLEIGHVYKAFIKSVENDALKVDIL